MGSNKTRPQLGALNSVFLTQFPKNVLRLFVRNNLENEKTNQDTQITLNMVIFSFFCGVFSERFLNITSRNKDSFEVKNNIKRILRGPFREEKGNTLLSGPMVYTLFPCFPRKMAYTVACFFLCDLGVGRQTEKGGVPRWWCIRFYPGHCSELGPRGKTYRKKQNLTRMARWKPFLESLWKLFLTWPELLGISKGSTYHPPKNSREINSENLQNCSCIKYQ